MGIQSPGVGQTSPPVPARIRPVIRGTGDLSAASAALNVPDEA